MHWIVVEGHCRSQLSSQGERHGGSDSDEEQWKERDVHVCETHLEGDS